MTNNSPQLGLVSLLTSVQESANLEVLLAEPRGFCAGVERAIEIVETVAAHSEDPIYVRHELVHNKRVVTQLRDKGVTFVEELAEVPDNAVLVLSAHGVSAEVFAQSQQRLKPFHDATCPLVSKVHRQVEHYAAQGYDCVLIGHSGHAEVEGTLGRFPKTATGAIYVVENQEQAQALVVHQPNNIAYVTQTTLSMDDCAGIIAILQERFPTIAAPRKLDICYATQNRQDAVKQLALEVDCILVVGSETSSNTARLVEIAKASQTPAFRVETIQDVSAISTRERVERIGITAGASTPEMAVQEVVAFLLENNVNAQVRPLSAHSEDVVFKVPKSIENLIKSSL